jgi:hypothetical protein
MTQVQRLARSKPPLCRFCASAADRREQAAENAKANAFLPQSHKEHGGKEEEIILNCQERQGIQRDSQYRTCGRISQFENGLKIA